MWKHLCAKYKACTQTECNEPALRWLQGKVANEYFKSLFCEMIISVTEQYKPFYFFLVFYSDNVLNLIGYFLFTIFSISRPLGAYIAN